MKSRLLALLFLLPFLVGFESKNWNGTSYSIPEAGDRNWADLTDFLTDLADNAQTTNFQKVGVRVATTTPVTVLAASDNVVITELAAPGAVTVNLPAGVTGQTFAIIDGTGDAASNNITIDPNSSETINGSSTYVINVNNGGVHIVYDGSDWKVVSEFVSSSSGTGTIARNKIAAGTADHVVINDGSGNLSSEATLAKSRGGAGADMSSVTFPSSGTLVTRDATETLTNKTLTSPTVTGGAFASPVLQTPQIDDTSQDHQYIFAPSELAADRTVTLPLLTGNDTFTFNAFAATLTNKSIDADDNTITDIDNNEIKAAAGIARSKLASGTASYVVINDGTGAFSEEATLAKSRGGTGADNSSVTFPASGTIPTNASTSTFTNKTIDGNSNTLTVLAGSQLSGAAPIANGGTGQTTATAGFDALAPTTTKGDIIANNGTDNVRVAVGTDGQVLTAASGETAGLSWTSPLTNPMDSDGDLIVGGASGAATKLDAGTTSQVLIGGTSPSWGTVTSAMITDGTIANADISASAAIEGSKIVAASTTDAGAITTGAQNIAGAKRFYSDLTVDQFGALTDEGFWASLDVFNYSSAGSASRLYVKGYNSSDWGTDEGSSIYTMAGGSLASYSDARLKTNIQDYQGGLALISSLRPVTFEWLDPTRPEGFQVGFIAQDVKEVYPSWVQDENPAVKLKDGTIVDNVLGIQFGQDFNAVVVKAIQELKAENEALRAEVKELRDAQ